MASTNMASTNTSRQPLHDPVVPPEPPVPPVEQQVGISQEEGVLRDVLTELDKERTLRAELESQMRKLAEENAKLKKEAESRPQPTREQKDAIVSRSRLISMEAQVKGYRELIDALTKTKPAIAAAASTTLPIHALRMLEIIPWDAAAKQFIHGTEVLFEWQIYDSRDSKWRSHLKYFPVLFKTLPIVRPGSNGSIIEETTSKDRSLLAILAGAAGDKATAAPSKHGTLTDEHITMVYNIEGGYPLPKNRGTWEWVGGWQIVKPIAAAIENSNVPCDDEGWSYARGAQDFNMDPIRFVTDHRSVSSTCRRRKWTRRRILVRALTSVQGRNNALSNPFESTGGLSIR
jgi:hypothetical protein